MTDTEKFIRHLKKRINPQTGEGYEYREIAELLTISKQATIAHVRNKAGCCSKCLRPLEPFTKPRKS